MSNGLVMMFISVAVSESKEVPASFMLMKWQTEQGKLDHVDYLHYLNFVKLCFKMLLNAHRA